MNGKAHPPAALGTMPPREKPSGLGTCIAIAKLAVSVPIAVTTDANPAVRAVVMAVV
jgi:hypothetical protein